MWIEKNIDVFYTSGGGGDNMRGFAFSHCI